MIEKSQDFDILKPVLSRTLREIYNLVGCESVAIRLHKDANFPYFLHENFSDFFIGRENSLHVRDEEGILVLDVDGTPFVECMCGNVLKRRFNPTFSFFTEKGSFWTNSTTQLLNTLTDEERREIGRTRDTCHHFGYESVALIPIPGKNDNLGLIQMNDPRDNMFTLEKIEEYELIAEQVGRAIEQVQITIEQVFHVFDLVLKFKNREKQT
jgi:hypothetical protein